MFVRETGFYSVLEVKGKGIKEEKVERQGDCEEFQVPSPPLSPNNSALSNLCACLERLHLGKKEESTA